MVDETVQIGNGLVDDVLSTPTLKLPPKESEAHQGKIDGVTYVEFESGAVAMQFALTSVNVPTVTDQFSLFVPKNFADDIHVDPTTLPAVEKNNQQQQYAIGIANEDGTATLQELRRIAYEQGRTTEGLEKPTNFEEFVSVINSLVVGLDVVFTRKTNPKAEDARFRNVLRANAIYNPNVVNNPKALKKFVKLWVTE